MALPVSGQEWLKMPSTVPGCPPGLEYLASIDQIVVKQIKELLEVLTGWETNNKYKIFNSMGQQCFYAVEETDLCMRLCCGAGRGFNIFILDNHGQQVMKVTRQFKCCAGCCWCANTEGCAFEVAIEAPVGQTIGYCRQEQSLWKPRFTIRNEAHDVIGHIDGPCCVCNSPCCGDVPFPVLSADRSMEIGKIAKQWTGALSEIFTDADTFSISFPMDMDVRAKATFLGALFLVDMMFFEQNNNN